MGNNSGSAVLQRFEEADLDYVELDRNVIHTVVHTGEGKTQQWARLVECLLNELAARRMARRPRGRPAKGPGSERLDGATEEERIAEVRKAYEHVTRREHRPARYAEVARRLGISPQTLWRFRNKYGWPPGENETRVS